MHLLVDLCQFVAAVLVAPILLLRSWKTGKYRTDWDQRRGHMRDCPAPTPDRPRVWIHAVSVGEMNAVRGLIARWREQRPETDIVISCTTDTGKARARELFPDLLVIRYPLDFSRFVRRALDRIKPSLIVLVELEVWFNFVTLAAKRGIPVAIINGRLSEKSVRWFSRIRPVARRMFGALAWVGAQDDTYAERFRRLGVPADRVSVTGSLKWETAQIADTLPGATELARAMGLQIEPETPARRMEPEAQARGSSKCPPNAQSAPAPSTPEPAPAAPRVPIWVCGSTGPGEESIILHAFTRLRQNPPLTTLQLVIVPRKPERFDEVAALIEQNGFTCVRRSRSPDGTSRTCDDKAVHLVDTMGELRKVYSLADLVFVGRSLVPMGGSDMMEVAALAKPIIVGPHTRNFADAMQQLLAAQAVTVSPRSATETGVVQALVHVAGKLLDNPDQRRSMGQRAREVVRRNLGATQRTLDRLLTLVPGPKSA